MTRTFTRTVALGLLLSFAAPASATLTPAETKMAATVDAGSWVRLTVILVFLFATLPVSSHMLARAALQEQDPDESIDEVPLAGGERSPNAKGRGVSSRG